MSTSDPPKPNAPPFIPAEPWRHGIYVLQNPHWNKLTAFAHDERAALGIEGLLPPSVETIGMQTQRALAQLDQKTTDLERYIYLVQLLDSSETLFYSVVMSDPARMLPIIYAPTVGEACLKFGHIFRRPRGMYITIEHKGRVREVLRNWPESDVRFICVTTGGRILGLGRSWREWNGNSDRQAAVVHGVRGSASAAAASVAAGLRHRQHRIAERSAVSGIAAAAAIRCRA